MLTILSAAVMASTGIPGAPAAAAVVVVQRPLLGGYRAVAVDDEGVQAAAAFAAQSVDAELAEVTSAERQTVAGANYKISFSTSDGRSYNAVVFRALNGSFSVTSIEETGDQGGNAAESEGESDAD